MGTPRRAFALAGARAPDPPRRARTATWAVSAGNSDHGRLGHGPSGSGDDALGLSSARFRSSNFPWTRSRRAREARTPCWSARTAPCTRAALTISASSGTPPAPRTRRFPKRWGHPHGDPVVAAAAGHFHTLCLTRDGEVWAFGRNDRAQCGAGRGPRGYAASAAQRADEAPDLAGGAGRRRPRAVTNIAAGAGQHRRRRGGRCFHVGRGLRGRPRARRRGGARFSRWKSSFLRASTTR